MKSLLRPRRYALMALLTTVLLAVGAAPAYADDLFAFDNNFPDFEDDAAPTDGGTLTVTATPTSITFTNTDTNDTIDSDDDDCTGDGTNSVTCTPAQVGVEAFFGWDAFMDDGNDIVVANGSLGGGIFGDDGNDVLTGSDANQDEEFLSGGDGTDQINSRNVGPRFPVGTFPDGATDGSPDPLQPVGDIVSGDDDGDVIVTGNGDDEVAGDFGLLNLAQRGSGGDGFPTGADQISTGAGNDFATGDCGDGDGVNLGDGDDFLFTFAHDGNGDVYEGGAGNDGIEFDSESEEGGAPCGADQPDGLPFDDFNVNLATGAANRTNNTPESDTATGFEEATTDPGNDTVAGNDSGNVLVTGHGNDLINPGNAADTVIADPAAGFGPFGNGPLPTSGNDAIDVADGWGDRVVCGAGQDTVSADQFDVDPNQDGNRADSLISADCEVVTVTEKRAGGADVIAPDCTIERVKRRYGRKAFLRGFNVRVTCNEAANLTVQLLVAYSKKLFPARAGDVVLSEKSATVAAGTAGTVKVKPLKKFRKRFRKKGFRARVNVEARDQYGNRSVERKTVRVKKVKTKKRRRR